MISFNDVLIKDSNQSIILDLEDESNVLLVCFGGIKGELPFPVFEFFNSLKEFKVNKVFVRDIHQAWYHKGLQDLTTDVQETAQYLQNLISKISYKKIVFMGNSSGGYAAILFGTMLNVDEIICFSPQTFINKFNRFWNRDNRWAAQLKELYAYRKLSKENLDLRLSLTSKTFSTKINVYFGEDHKLDSKHANHIRKCKNVYLNPVKYSSHNVIKHLRDNGELIQILNSKF